MARHPAWDEYPRITGCYLHLFRMAESRASIRARVQAAHTYHRILKLAGCEEIESVHLAEALQYRPKLLMV